VPTRPPTHKPRRLPAPDGRAKTAERGYGAAWRRLRAARLAIHPFCEAPGCTSEATDVDHVTAKAKGGADDAANLMSLCHACHSKKTCAVDGGFGRRAT
jgi:5-methylcytosine-specific restriction protein A